MCEFSFVNMWFLDNKDVILDKIFTVDNKNIVEMKHIPEFLIIKQKAHNLFWSQYFEQKNNLYSQLYNHKCMTMKITYKRFLNLVLTKFKNKKIKVILYVPSIQDKILFCKWIPFTDLIFPKIR